jgi:hypothetical protein
MKIVGLAVALILLSGTATAIAQNDLQQRQLEKNSNRRSRQADVIKEMPQDDKADAAKKARDRNEDVRDRQKDINQNRRDR